MRATIARLALAAASLLAIAAAFARPARAAETRYDVESDHLDAFDDGGPRTFGLLANPLALAVGTLGVEGDLVLGDTAAMSVGGDLVSTGGTTAYGASVGLPIYPWRLVFHGFYVHPRLAWARATSQGASVDVFGGGATMGWQWTWRLGLTLRAGAGVAYERTVPDSGPGVAITGVRPLLDGAVGWVF
jgi:hypothetical protein